MNKLTTRMSSTDKKSFTLTTDSKDDIWYIAHSKNGTVHAGVLDDHHLFATGQEEVDIYETEKEWREAVKKLTGKYPDDPEAEVLEAEALDAVER